MLRRRLLFFLLLVVAVLVAVPATRNLAWIAAGRARDALVAKFGPAHWREARTNVVERAGAQATELDRYFSRLRETATATPEIRALRYASPADFAESAGGLRRLLAASLSFPPPGELRPVLREETPVGEDAAASYVQLRIQIFEDLHAVGLLVLPKAPAAGRRPLVVASHGRGGSPAVEADGKVGVMTASSRDLAAWAVRRGWIVWMPVFVFYRDDGPPDVRERLAVRAQEAGTTLPAVELQKMLGALDVLLTRPDVDPTRVFATGHSYGGFYTLMAAALDPRIKAAVVAAYFNDRAEVLDASEPIGYLDWRYPQSLRALRDPFVAALVCPRPLLIVAGTHDQLFPVAGARRAADEAREFYRRLGLENRFEYFEFTARHDFDGAAAGRFLDAVKPE